MAERTQQHQTAHASPARWKIGVCAAIGAMAIAAAIIWIPYWPVQVLLLVGAAVFVIVVLRDPAYFFMRMTGVSLGAAAGIGSLPAIKAGFGLADGTWAALVLDNSPWVAMVLAVAGCVFGVLELVHRRPPSPSLPPAPPAAPPSGPVTAYNAPVTATTHQGPVNTGTVQHQTINYHAAPPSPAATAISPIAPRSTVPTPSATFIPRQNITKKIHDALTANPEQVVVRQAVARALGGYGKTVAAILYADQYKEHYPGGRFFLSVESGGLVAALASLAPPLGLTSANDPAADAAAVKDALEHAVKADGTPAATLLILDNVASAAAWAAMLACGLVPRGGCRVLITTRDDAIDPAGAIKVGRLEPAEAREVYRLFCERRRDREQDESKRAALPPALPDAATADAITEWLGGLAVSVAAVAAYMKIKRHLAWEAYWNGGAGGLRGLRNTPVAELPEMRADVEAQLQAEGHEVAPHRRALKVIDDAFAALPAPERRAVEYAALLPHDLAPAAWLETLLETDAARPPQKDDGSPDPMRLELAADPDDDQSPARAVLAHLDELDILLTGGEGGKLLSLHRLWHARVNERAEAEGIDRGPLRRGIGACARARRAVIVGTHPGGTDRGLSNPAALTEQGVRWELTPLARACAMLWEIGLPGAGAGVGVWLASVLQDLGRFTEAAACLPLSSATDAAVEESIGHQGLAAAYSNLALIQKDQGDLPGARASMEQAIAIKSKRFAPDHPTFATSYSNLALIQKAQGDLAGARASMERAIAIDSKHFAPDHPTFATRYSNLALIQQAQGDLPGARGSLERAIAIESKHFAPDHPTFATSYSNLATIQQAQGDLPGARASLERAIEIASKHFAPDHPNFATSYWILATIDYAEGKQAAACTSLQRALGIATKHFDEEHPQVKGIRSWITRVGCDE